MRLLDSQHTHFLFSMLFPTTCSWCQRCTNANNGASNSKTQFHLCACYYYNFFHFELLLFPVAFNQALPISDYFPPTIDAIDCFALFHNIHLKQGWKFLQARLKGSLDLTCWRNTYETKNLWWLLPPCYFHLTKENISNSFPFRPLGDYSPGLLDWCGLSRHKRYSWHAVKAPPSM